MMGIVPRLLRHRQGSLGLRRLLAAADYEQRAISTGRLQNTSLSFYWVCKQGRLCTLIDTCTEFCTCYLGWYRFNGNDITSVFL